MKEGTRKEECTKGSLSVDISEYNSVAVLGELS